MKSTSKLLNRNPSKKNNAQQDESHLDNYIKSISPFANLDLKKEKSMFVPPFIDPPKKRKTDIPDSAKFRRSGTNLLGQLKEEHKREERVGVPPKDLGFGLLKDLIDLSDEDDVDLDQEVSKKPKQQLTRKKTQSKM